MGRGEKKSMPSFFDYTLSNLYTAGQQPNTIHVSDTGLSYMFRKQLFEKAISVFDFTMPDNWDKDYFRYSQNFRKFHVRYSRTGNAAD